MSELTPIVEKLRARKQEQCAAAPDPRTDIKPIEVYATRAELHDVLLALHELMSAAGSLEEFRRMEAQATNNGSVVSYETTHIVRTLEAEISRA